LAHVKEGFHAGADTKPQTKAAAKGKAEKAKAEPKPKAETKKPDLKDNSDKKTKE